MEKEKEKTIDLWLFQILDVSAKDFRITVVNMMRKIEERWDFTRQLESVKQGPMEILDLKNIIAISN